jgi:formamidopyrimidine-DNA glycosylase
VPELPEVETIKRELARKIVGQVIRAVKIDWPKAVLPASVHDFEKIVVGKKVTALNRRAKMLIISLSGGIDLVVHLKMTGQLILLPKNGRVISGGHPTEDLQTPGRHTRLTFFLGNGDTLFFNDLRKFGWIRILDEKLRRYIQTEVGIEPLSKEFSAEFFHKTITHYPNRTIKQVMLDQKIVAGIGNIYADEAAHLSGIMPSRKIKGLRKNEIVDLHRNIVGVLKLSVAKKGTTSNNYRRSNGERGGFKDYLKVYGREGEKCKRCGSPIQKIKHAGRGTHFCKKCQR